MSALPSNLPARPVAGREELQLFYDLYNEALDDLALERWPLFFTADCLYRITARENWEAGLPLSTLVCESRGMMNDRVVGWRRTMTYAPRAYRRFQSGLRVVEATAEAVRVRSNFLVVQVLIDKPAEVAFVGVAHDRLVRDGDDLRLAERICVLDSEMLPNSLIYPI